MWLKHIENPECVRAIFGDSYPSLDGLEVFEVKLTLGMDISVSIRFDLPTLPEKMPDKWLKKQVNAVTLTLTCFPCKVESVRIDGSIYTNCSIEIGNVEDYKSLVLLNDTGIEIMKIATKFLTVYSLYGYSKEI
jgi:hypothetical protein